VKTYIRKPFTVEAVRITEENIEELAPKIGDIATRPDGTRYIVVDRRLVPNIYRAYVGYWVTFMEERVRVFDNKVFEEQFTLMDNDTASSYDILLNGI